MSNLFVGCKLLHPDAQMPKYQTEGASGMDLSVLSVETFTEGYTEASLCDDEEGFLRLAANGIALFHTGIALSIPEGWEGQVRPRSSLSAKGILCQLGTIDSDYRGEIKVILVNLSGEPFEIKRGDRIAQLVLAPIGRAVLNQVEVLDATVRNTGGFGSSGR